MRKQHGYAVDPIYPTRDVISEIHPKDMRPLYRLHWSHIRSHAKIGKVASTYNIRLQDLTLPVLEKHLAYVYDMEPSAFKINLAFGMILRDVITGELRYY
jgi:hypothetical protein